MAKAYRPDVYESIAGVPVEGLRVSWAGVWSGFLVGVGALLLFSVLGLAIGISAADLTGAQGMGVGAAIWSSLSLLVSVFLGGMVATRVGFVLDRTVAMVQGTLVWVLAILGILYLTASGIGAAAGGLLSGLTGGVGVIAAGSSQLEGLATGDVDQIVARLRDPQTVGVVAAVTGMSEQQARSYLEGIRLRVEAARQDPARAAAEARQGLQSLAAQAQNRAASAAAAAQPYASAAAWITLIAMILSLVAAIWGSMISRSAAEAPVRVERE